MDCFARICPHSRNDSRYVASGMNGVRDMRSSICYDWSEHYQLCGILHKKPVNSPSNKWSKRFFLIKDGYLFYYPENEKKEMEKRKCLNIHPKGIIPLGQCSITETREASQPYAFIIDNNDIHNSCECETEQTVIAGKLKLCKEVPCEGKLILAADSSFDRDKWIEMLEKSKRINWAAAQLADSMIKQLEEHGLQMAKQKQDYFDQLQTEVMALSEEKERSEELARVNQELEVEKAKLEKYSQELMDEFDDIKKELEDTADHMKHIEQNRTELSETIKQQQQNLQTLAEEKQRIMKSLMERESQNQSLHQSKEEIEGLLQQIERKTQLLLEEKSVAEQRLKDNEEKASMLEEEKAHISEHANELNETIKDLKAQKAMTESELREEVIARMDAERKLREAHESLTKLGVAVESQTPNIHHEVKEEMVVNVGKLRKFFEGLTAEATLDSDKPMIVKNSIHARKTLQRRAKTKQFERRRASSMRVKSLNFDRNQTDDGGPLSPVRRCLTTARKGMSLNIPMTTNVVYEEHL